MDLTSKKTIQEVFSRHHDRPKKGLGQNFLVSRQILTKILQAANIKQRDIILEIGPGIGTLTCELAKLSKKVIAVEKDPKMIDILQESVAGHNNVEGIQGDILKIFPALPISTPYKVAANLPYYITSPVIRMLLEARRPPRKLILMVQKEVAQRICAAPPKMSLLAVSVQFYAKPKIVSYVSRTSFWPQPKVDSAIIKITPRRSAHDSARSSKPFFRIVKAGFSQPRKQIINNFIHAFGLDRTEIKKWLLNCKIDPSQRPQTLRLKDWMCLARNFPL